MGAASSIALGKAPDGVPFEKHNALKGFGWRCCRDVNGVSEQAPMATVDIVGTISNSPPASRPSVLPLSRKGSAQAKSIPGIPENGGVNVVSNLQLPKKSLPSVNALDISSKRGSLLPSLSLVGNLPSELIASVKRLSSKEKKKPPADVDMSSTFKRSRGTSFFLAEGEDESPLEELLLAPKAPCPERDAVLKNVMSKVQKTMGVAIAKLNVFTKDDDPLLKLGVLQYIRGAFLLQLKKLPGAWLVKADDERLFLAGSSSADLIKAGLALLNLCGDLTARYMDLRTTCSVGVSAGSILLLRNDFYGDPVNTASKLGEDNASPGELAVSKEAIEEVESSAEGLDLLGRLIAVEKEVMISKVCIKYALITMRSGDSVVTLFPRLAVPSLSTIYDTMVSSKKNPSGLMCLEALPVDWGKAAKDNPTTRQQLCHLLTRHCTMMQTDMSGFTRLTRQYGIMHFLALIMHCRRIYDETIAEFGGHVVKYDGDNVITFFSTPEMGVLAALQILSSVNDYNRGLEADFQIRLKFGMSCGEILVVGEDIAGDAWDHCCTLGEDLAEVGEILVTTAVRDSLRSSKDFAGTFEKRTTELPPDETAPFVYYNLQPAATAP